MDDEWRMLSILPSRRRQLYPEPSRTGAARHAPALVLCSGSRAIALQPTFATARRLSHRSDNCPGRTVRARGREYHRPHARASLSSRAGVRRYRKAHATSAQPTTRGCLSGQAPAFAPTTRCSTRRRSFCRPAHGSSVTQSPSAPPTPMPPACRLDTSIRLVAARRAKMRPPRARRVRRADHPNLSPWIETVNRQAEKMTPQWLHARANAGREGAKHASPLQSSHRSSRERS